MRLISLFRSGRKWMAGYLPGLSPSPLQRRTVSEGDKPYIEQITRLVLQRRLDSLGICRRPLASIVDDPLRLRDDLLAAQVLMDDPSHVFSKADPASPSPTPRRKASPVSLSYPPRICAEVVLLSQAVHVHERDCPLPAGISHNQTNVGVPSR